MIIHTIFQLIHSASAFLAGAFFTTFLTTFLPAGFLPPVEAFLAPSFLAGAASAVFFAGAALLLPATASSSTFLSLLL